LATARQMERGRVDLQELAVAHRDSITDRRRNR
jgi:hypothetical protein